MRITPEAPTPDWDSIESALESPDPELRSYYDTVTGEVHITGPFEDDPGEREMIDGDPRRFREIGRLESGEEHRWMTRFADEEVADGRLRGMLDVALHGRGCFRRFKDVLLSAPAERARWFAYRDRMLKAAVERWFTEHELPVGTPPPWRVASPAHETAAHAG